MKYCILLIILISSCKKKYIYVETYREDFLSADTLTNVKEYNIDAPDDSTAYLIGWERWLKTVKMCDYLESKNHKKQNCVSTFSIKNNKGEFIDAGLQFHSKKKREAEIYEKIFHEPFYQ